MSFTQQLHTWSGVIMAGTLGVMGFFANPAESRQCDTFDGGQICYTLTKEVGDLNQWNVTILSNQGDEFIDVTCNGKQVYDWSSRGQFSQDEVELITKMFCAA